MGGGWGGGEGERRRGDWLGGGRRRWRGGSRSWEAAIGRGKAEGGGRGLGGCRRIHVLREVFGGVGVGLVRIVVAVLVALGWTCGM